jgi:hypothetical protein
VHQRDAGQAGVPLNTMSVGQRTRCGEEGRDLEAVTALFVRKTVDLPARDRSCADRLELDRVRSPTASAALTGSTLKGSVILRRPQRQAMHLVDGRSDPTDRFPAAAERHVLVSGDVLAMHGPRLGAGESIDPSRPLGGDDTESCHGPGAARRRGKLAAAAARCLLGAFRAWHPAVGSQDLAEALPNTALQLTPRAWSQREVLHSGVGLSGRSVGGQRPRRS